MRQILVTSALPYANGSIHIGHLVEYIQTDIWVRFQKLRGNQCIYVCADDTHGTPIMMRAKSEGITPEVLIANMHAEHKADFAQYLIEFDNYYSTNSPENQQLSEAIYLAAKDQGYIEIKEIQQYFCPTDQMFLPDRFIKGECPRCHAMDQYGDSCENCAATYSPTDLMNPRCQTCGTAPILKSSEHHFFRLSAFTDRLKQWLDADHVKQEIKNKLAEWFETGLQDWDISRDAPYFGFKIPGTDDKYFYVWLDAPVGYLASTQNWCASHSADFDEIWKNGNFEIHHFIGKDILYFHALFWPAMCWAGGYKTPDKLHIHGFLTVNGEKMSKSRGTFIKASDFARVVNPEYLRYYYAAKLMATVEDLDLSFQDFTFKVNADVVNKFVNIASRTTSVLHKKCGGVLSTPDADGLALLQQTQAAAPSIAEHYENLEYLKATKEIMALADAANKYINDKAPWDVAKTDVVLACQICTSALNAFRILAIYLKPILPGIVMEVETLLGIPPLTWQDVTTTISNCPIQPYVRLAERIDEAVLVALQESLAGQ